MTDLEALDAAFVRVEEMLWLPGALVEADSGNGGLAMLLQRFPTRADAPLFDALPQLRALIGRPFETDATITDDAVAALADVSGFIFSACAATLWHRTPTPSFADWGSTWNAWLYASNERQIVRAAVTWAATRHAIDRENGRAKYGWSGD